jgi:hypothetical protein
MIPALGPQISTASRAFKSRAITSSSAASSPGQADGGCEKDDRILVIVGLKVRRQQPPSPRGASAMTKPQRRILLASAKILLFLARRPAQHRARAGPRLTTVVARGLSSAPVGTLPQYCRNAVATIALTKGLTAAPARPGKPLAPCRPRRAGG